MMESEAVDILKEIRDNSKTIILFLERIDRRLERAKDGSFDTKLLEEIARTNRIISKKVD